MVFKFLRSVMTVLVVASPGAAIAGTIDIVGFVQYVNQPPLGLVSFAGNRGFTLVGLAPSGGGILAPPDQCLGAPALCAPGTAIDVHASSSGNDLPGNATLDGVFYANVGALGPPPFPVALASFNFTGEVTAPPFKTSGFAAVTAPVNFSGLFLHDDGSGGTVEQLVASARATLSLQEIDCCGGPAWVYNGIRYDLEPVPEPGTLLLLGTALTGLGLLAPRLRQP